MWKKFVHNVILVSNLINEHAKVLIHNLSKYTSNVVTYGTD